MNRVITVFLLERMSYAYNLAGSDPVRFDVKQDSA